MLYSSLRLKPLVLSRFRLIRDDLTAWIQHNVVSAGCWFSSLTVHLNSTVFSAQQQLVKTAPSNIILPVLVLKGGKGELGRKVYFCPLSHVTRAIDKIEEHWEEGLYDIGFQYRLLEETQFSWVHKTRCWLISNTGFRGSVMHFDAILGLYSMGNPLTNCAPEQLYSQTFNIKNKTTWKTSYENLIFFLN